MDIKKVIKEHGYTVERVANEMKPRPISKGTLSQSINKNPTVETLQRIADVIGCKVGDFFADECTGTGLRCPVCGAELELKQKEVKNIARD